MLLVACFVLVTGCDRLALVLPATQGRDSDKKVLAQFPLEPADGPFFPRNLARWPLEVASFRTDANLLC